MNLTKEITDNLFKQFDTHKYMLANSYVYKWESDFFSELKSGYHQEIEVKISRSDFLADFKKAAKHRILAEKNKGAVTICYRGATYYEVVREETRTKLDERGRRMFDEFRKPILENTGKRTKFLTTLEKNVRGEVSRTPKYSTIRFADPHAPNRFYYCCPTDLIKPDEVPEYAGLLYYENGRFRKVKNAPLIHKEKRNLSKILLDKFYFKYLYSR